MDVLKLSEHLKLDNTVQLWENEYVITDKGQNGTLLPRLKFAGLSPGFCPFVINDWNDEKKSLKGFCSIHKQAKPLICRMAPVAREVDIEEDTEEFFIKEPVEGCPGTGASSGLYLADYLKPLKEELFLEKKWFMLMSKMLEREISPEEILKTFFHFPLPADINTLMEKWEKALT